MADQKRGKGAKGLGAIDPSQMMESAATFQYSSGKGKGKVKNGFDISNI